MKKIIFLTLILYLFTGCSKENQNIGKNNIESTEPIVKEEEIIETYIDNNPIKVGLYQNNKLVKSYTTKLGNYKDIGVFDVYYTNQETLDNNKQKDNYLKYYNSYENIEEYKTAFYISFEVNEEKIEQLILDPNNQYSMTPYLFVYLYDDINQLPGTYYSHLEPKDMKDNTIISSIKLFLAQEGTKITSPITITVFTYKDDLDFTEDKKYRGNSSYTFIINTN